MKIVLRKKIYENLGCRGGGGIQGGCLFVCSRLPTFLCCLMTCWEQLVLVLIVMLVQNAFHHLTVFFYLFIYELRGFLGKLIFPCMCIVCMYVFVCLCVCLCVYVCVCVCVCVCIIVEEDKMQSRVIIIIIISISISKSSSNSNNNSSVISVIIIITRLDDPPSKRQPAEPLAHSSHGLSPDAHPHPRPASRYVFPSSLPGPTFTLLPSYPRRGAVCLLLPDGKE